MNAQAQQQKKNSNQQGKKPRTAITPTRDEDFPIWYQNVIKAAELAENSPVRGCMIIKPYGFALWENIQRALDDRIKEHDVENAYFPLLIPLEFISREAEHVDGFAKECAVVTHHRLVQGENGLVPDEAAKLEEPYVIRPTSETIIGDSMARWIQSYRDLPLKLNQWCNVMRWEMRTRMFLRTSEFLWQEGHNAFATEDEALKDAYTMLEVYRDLFENVLAIPVICGEKTEDERFPGAVNTLTIEAMMQDGKALQAGTSHYLGQNFAKSIGIKYQAEDGQEHFVHTTSWGVSTRSIGGLLMVHGDDDGVQMPPRVAPVQVQIIPIIRDDAAQGEIFAYCDKIAAELKAKNIRAKVDKRDERTPDKMWGAVKKGVPIRVEIGANEVSDGQVTHVRRDVGKPSKTTCSVDQFVSEAQDILDDIHNGLYQRAKLFRDERIQDVSSLEELAELYKNGYDGFARSDIAIWNNEAFEKVTKEHSLTPRCMPFDDEGKKLIIGKSY